MTPLYPYYVLNALCRYGEGWDFGEVAKNGRGTNASQFNISNTGIGRYMNLYLLLFFVKKKKKIFHSLLTARGTCSNFLGNKYNQFQRSYSRCSSWWISVWPSSSAGFCHRFEFGGNHILIINTIFCYANLVSYNVNIQTRILKLLL